MYLYWKTKCILSSSMSRSVEFCIYRQPHAVNSNCNTSVTRPFFNRLSFLILKCSAYGRERNCYQYLHTVRSLAVYFSLTRKYTSATPYHNSQFSLTLLRIIPNFWAKVSDKAAFNPIWCL